MKERLLKIRETATEMIEASSSLKELEDLRIKFLGKKGELTDILKGMGKLSITLHSKIVVMMTLTLILVGFVLFFVYC